MPSEDRDSRSDENIERLLVLSRLINEATKGATEVTFWDFKPKVKIVLRHATSGACIRKHEALTQESAITWLEDMLLAFRAKCVPPAISFKIVTEGSK